MASDFVLVSQLFSFMEAIPILWTWEDLRSSYGNGETYTEQRGPNKHLLQFEFQILEEGAKGSVRYIHIAASVTDSSREMRQKGGSITPLSTSFLFFENGELNMPTAREIYERPF